MARRNKRLGIAKSEVERGKRRDDRGFGAKNQAAKRRLVKARAGSGFEFGVGPAAFGTDGEGGESCFLRGENFSKRRSVLTFRQNYAKALAIRGEGGFGFCQ